MAQDVGRYRWKDSNEHDGKLIINTYAFTPLPEAKDHQAIPGPLGKIAYSINPATKPFYKVHHLARIENDIVYDVFYESGAFGFRLSPESMYAKNPTKHLIVAGDSNTFGQGVESKYTLPIRLVQNFPDYRPYNWGIRGAGPNNILAFMEFFPWENLVKESTGLFIYNYNDYQLERVIGSKNFIGWSGGVGPYYELDDNGEAIYRGNFKNSTFTRKLLTKIYMFIGSYGWLNNLLPILPRYRYQHSVIAAKIFLKMQNQYKEKFPNGQFIVAINERRDENVPHLEDLKIELAKNKVTYVLITRERFDPRLVWADYHLNVRGHIEEERQFLKVLSLNKIIR